MRATLDHHGFTRVIKVLRLAPVIAVPLRLRLRPHGVGQWSSLEGAEESLQTFSVTFRLTDRGRRRYSCDGCALCRPVEVEQALEDSLTRAVARALDAYRKARTKRFVAALGRRRAKGARR